MAEHVPDEDERRWIEPALLALLGIGEAPTAQREELFAAWRTFFERVAASGTVAMVFEDLQWADPGLLDFIDHLLEWSQGVAHLHRDPGPPGAPRAAAGLGRGTPQLQSRWPSSRCPSGDARVAGRPRARPAGDAPCGRSSSAPRASRCTPSRRSGCCVADGRLEATADGYRPVGDLGALAVPETLHALIAARLDALDPTDRSLLQDASVLGQSFTVRALAAVNGADEADARSRACAASSGASCCALDVDPRSPERGQYGFVQGLIREVAYGTLARRDRRARHLAAARYFEALGDDELAGVLAAHYLAAYQAAPDGEEGEAVAIQARLALRGAADRARALGSYDQVLGFPRGGAFGDHRTRRVLSSPNRLARPPQNSAATRRRTSFVAAIAARAQLGVDLPRVRRSRRS